MPDGKQSKVEKCPSFGAAAKRTVVVGFDLVGATTMNFQSIVDRALADPLLQEKVALELRKAGEQLMKEQANGKGVSVTRSLSTLASAADKKSQVSKPLVKELKATPEFRVFDKSLSELKCSFDQSPVGVFVDDNKTTLIIVGVVAALAGGVAMYRARSGDTVAKAANLVPHLTPALSLGSIDISLDKFKFKPSDQRLEIDLKAKGKFSILDTQLKLSSTFVNEKIVGAGGEANLVLTIDPRTQLTTNAKFVWSKDNTDARDTIDASLSLGGKRKLSNHTDVTLQLFGKYVDNKDGLKYGGGLKADLKISEPLGKGTSLTLQPSYSVEDRFMPNPQGDGFQAHQREHRVCLNAVLRFGKGK